MDDKKPGGNPSGTDGSGCFGVLFGRYLDFNFFSGEYPVDVIGDK